MVPKLEQLVVHDPFREVVIPETGLNIFAVVKINGKQLKVTVDDEIVLEKIELPVGTVFDLGEVLLVGTRDYTSIGRPVVESAAVKAVVEQQTLSEKTIVYKKNRRKGHQKSLGHRQQLTTARIISIDHSPAADTVENYVPLDRI